MSETQNTPRPPDSGEVHDALAFPASVQQQAFWYMELLHGDVTAFNVPLRFRLTGPLDPKLLERSFNTIIERHEALRTRFEEDQGELLQIIMPEMVLKLEMTDISRLPAESIDSEADRLAGLEACQPFCLATGPMIRAGLVRISAESHILLLTVHHALFDGLSITVLTRELASIYQAYFDGKPCPLAPLAIQYGDFSIWQKDFLASPAMIRQLDYWKQRLTGMTEIDLPTDFPRPPVKSWKGDVTSISLPKELTNQLHAIAAKNGATLFHLQLAAYNILLQRYCGSRDIAVGTPVTGRTREEIEPLIGVFINSLILRNNLSGNPLFGNFLSQVRETALTAIENQDLPFECLVRELRPERLQSRNPLFQVNFNHHRSFTQAGTFGGVSLTPMASRTPGTIFDLHFLMVERNDGWRASCDYSTDLFTRSSADRMLGHFKKLLEEIAAHPEKRIDTLEILTDSEKHAILSEWSGPSSDYPRECSIGELFVKTATHFPTRTAIDSGGRSITYQQLHAEASYLARSLINLGAGPGKLLAISAKPSPEMIVGFLAILMAGACCVPIDPDYPADRFTLLLEDCDPEIALATSGCACAYPGSWKGRLLAISPVGTRTEPTHLPNLAPAAPDPAYLLFTSGSTGRPKGVMITHRGVIRLVKNNGFMPITEHDVFLQTAPVSFDASLLEIWGPLLNGGRLVLLPEGPSLSGIASAVHNKGVTTLWLTSGLFQLMVDEQLQSLRGLRHLLAGGDVLSIPHVRRALDALPDTLVINGYGPTENTTFTTCHPITRADLGKNSIPIGRPIANTSVYLLDADLRPVPIGIPGELFTGGDGLAIGYHQSPDLTAEKFINHPQFGRLYRTGDLCRWADDGSIEFIGRRDHQVKIRGFRIEPGEIEAALTSHPNVTQAKVAIRGDGAENKRILAWVIPSHEEFSENDLARFITARLPAFMRPESIGIIQSFPLNANGKIDVAALPDPGRINDPSVPQQAEHPVGEVETHLASIWMELLSLPKIDRNADFFTLGGHSLMALRMFSRINREFGKSLPLATLIRHPTIASLAILLAPAVDEPAAPHSVTSEQGNVVTLAEGSDQSPLFCIHGGDGGVLFYRNLANLLPKGLPIHAIESLELGNHGMINSNRIEETAATYLKILLARQSQGPFRLAGYSFGGVVAHEMACQLTAQGHSVEFLGLFDTHNPASPSRNYSTFERLRVFWHQSAGLPLIKRFSRLRTRINEGLHTHRRVRAELAAATSSGPAEAYSDLRRIQVREENWRAMQAYQPGVFRGRITLFKAISVSDKIEWEADYGWSCKSGAGLEIVPISGEHLTIFDQENVQSLADALSSTLARIAPIPLTATPAKSVDESHDYVAGIMS